MGLNIIMFSFHSTGYFQLICPIIFILKLHMLINTYCNGKATVMVLGPTMGIMEWHYHLQPYTRQLQSASEPWLPKTKLSMSPKDV